MTRRLLPMTLLLGLAAAPFPQQAASASCAAPYLQDTPRSAERGESVTIQGRAFVDGCQDSMGCSTGAFGCQSCTYDEPPEVPLEDVELWLVQGERRWMVDVSDAGTASDNQLGHVSWTFDVPRHAEPGPARLRTQRAQPERITIR